MKSTKNRCKIAPKSVQKRSGKPLGEFLEAISLRNLDFKDFEGFQGGPWELLGLVWVALGAPWGSKRVLLGAPGDPLGASGVVLECFRAQKPNSSKSLLFLSKTNVFLCPGIPRSSQNRSEIALGTPLGKKGMRMSTQGCPGVLQERKVRPARAFWGARKLAELTGTRGNWIHSHSKGYQCNHRCD